MDALDTWGTGRNKLAPHESNTRSSKNIVYWSNIYPNLQNTIEVGVGWGGGGTQKNEVKTSTSEIQWRI